LSDGAQSTKMPKDILDEFMGRIILPRHRESHKEEIFEKYTKHYPREEKPSTIEDCINRLKEKEPNSYEKLEQAFEDKDKTKNKKKKKTRSPASSPSSRNSPTENEQISSNADSEDADINKVVEESPKELDSTIISAEAENKKDDKHREKFVVSVLTLLIVAIAIGFAMWGNAGFPYSENDLQPESLQRSMCREEAVQRIPEAVQHVIELTGEIDSGEGSLSDSLEEFAEALLFDWTNFDDSDFPPRHAVSIRLQSNNADALSVTFSMFLNDLFTPECRAQHVLEVDVGAAQSVNLVTLANSFMLERKQACEENIALVVFNNVSTKESSHHIMSFKDHLDRPEIIVSFDPEKKISSRGVGFVFLGASLPDGEACTKGSIEYHDQKLAWYRNMQGRVTLRARLCAPSQDQVEDPSSL